MTSVTRTRYCETSGAISDTDGTAISSNLWYDSTANSAGTSYSTQSFLSYDALGRVVSQSATLSTAPNFIARYMQYDLAGRRTQESWGSDGFFVTYDYDTLGEMTAIRENGAANGAGVLASVAYDDLGRRTSLTRGARRTSVIPRREPIPFHPE